MDPLSHEDYFNVSSLFSIQSLFNARVHLGHQVGTLNPHMEKYMFGSRLGQCIFDLDETSKHLKDALNFLSHVVYNDGIILFVCRSPQFTNLVERTAKDCGEFSHCREWIEALFTDSEKVYGALTRLPDTVIVLNTLDTVLEQHPAVVSSAKLLIPTIGITDSNCDPRLITYPVPGNDDSHLTMKFYCELFKNTILNAKAKRKEDEEKTKEG